MTRKGVSRNNLLGPFAMVALLTCSFVPVKNSLATSLTCTENAQPCSVNSTFNVNVNEMLSVSITKPDVWVTGNTGDFLRNTVSLSVSSNNGNGFTASMNSKTTTNLVNKENSNATIPTLSSNTTKSAFDAGRWGYSLSNYTAANDSVSTSDSTSGVDGSTYKPLNTSAITILYSDSAATGTQDVYFGAKAGNTTASGTYANTVVFSVVSGVVDNNNPAIPSDPVVPGDDTTADDGNSTTVAKTDGDYVVTTNTSTGTGSYSITSGSTTTNTQVTTSTTATDLHAAPQGVTDTVAANVTNITTEGTPLATGLAVSAAVAAATGGILFFVAKRKEDEEEETK